MSRVSVKPHPTLEQKRTLSLSLSLSLSCQKENNIFGSNWKTTSAKFSEKRRVRIAISRLHRFVRFVEIVK